jgi:hypothetical protein
MKLFLKSCCFLVLYTGFISLLAACNTSEEKKAPNLLFVFSDQHTNVRPLIPGHGKRFAEVLRDSLWKNTAGWMEDFEDEFYTHEDLKVWSKEQWDQNYKKLPIEVLRASI